MSSLLYDYWHVLSPIDFFFSTLVSWYVFMFLKNNCKRFNRLTQKKSFLHINLTGLLQNTLFLWKDEEKLIHQCFRAGNKQTLFWVVVHKYFVRDQTKAGKEILLQANIEEDKKCKYGLSIMRIKRWGNRNTVISSKSTRWKTIAAKLSTNPSTYNFWNKHILHPK